MTTADEVAAVVAAEQLQHANLWGVRGPHAYEVGIQVVDGGWRVYSTDERASERYDVLHESESVALDDFLFKLRALNRYFRRRAARRSQ